MRTEPILIIKRRFTSRLLESLLLVLAIALGIGASAAGISLFMNIQTYNYELLESVEYNEIIVSTVSASDDMETAVLESPREKGVSLAITDLEVSEIIPPIQYAYLESYRRMHFLNQNIQAPPPGGAPQGNDSEMNRFEEMQMQYEEAKGDSTYIFPTAESISGRSVTPEYFNAHKLTVEVGSLFTAADMTSNDSYIIVGQTLAAQLVNDSEYVVSTVDLIGKKILSFGDSYTIVGILNTTHQVYDQLFFTAEKQLAGGGQFVMRGPDFEKQLHFYVSSPADLQTTADSLKDYFDEVYGIGQIVISNPRTEGLQIMARNQGISALILFIGLAGLFIASVNVSNMLMSRAMRMKKHIGILKALGASKAGIVKLFLWEISVIISLGTLLGFGLAIPLNSIMEQSLTSLSGSWISILSGVLASAVLTFGFSLLPALQHAKGDAALAMRASGN